MKHVRLQKIDKIVDLKHWIV